ncbi:DUF6107 family protein [Chelativorans sp. J32]|uniref:DUF6107 family protein n=1 Tax=Chelativorans sp. J32 TaxID=935840 RepID=UPI003528CD07
MTNWKDQQMTGLSEAALLWAAKAAGAIVGSAISIAYLLPSGRREAAIRFAVGVACGFVFGGTAGLKIATELGIAGRLAPSELVMMGSAAASLCAWSAIGLVTRLLTTAARSGQATEG